jgi:hypothetical protein
MSTNQFPLPCPDEMRILTLNLWGRNGEWTDRRSVLIEGLRASTQPGGLARSDQNR